MVMVNQRMDDLIDSSHFIDDRNKEKCKEYFRQIPKAEVDWVYSSAIPDTTYQGDIVDKFEMIFYEVSGTNLNARALENVPCILFRPKGYETRAMRFRGLTGKSVFSSNHSNKSFGLASNNLSAAVVPSALFLK